MIDEHYDYSMYTIAYHSVKQMVKLKQRTAEMSL